MLASEAAWRDSLTRFVSHVHSHWHHDSCVQPSRKRDKEFMKHKHFSSVLLFGRSFLAIPPRSIRGRHFFFFCSAQPALNI
jgi:hypothetical protein